MSFLPVSLATLEVQLPTGPGWIYEAKLDGYRIEAVVNHRAKAPVTLYSRNANDWTARFPLVAEALADLPVERATFDGEIVVPVARGQSAFQALQRSLEAGVIQNVHYVLFDLLALDDVDLRAAPLRDRQSLLRALLQHRAARSPLRAVKRYSPRGGAVLARACADGLEGLVCKQLDGSYQSGRHRGWIKVKCIRRQEFVVVGYTEPRGSRTGFGALLLAVYDANGRLHFAGKVGSGFDTVGLATLYDRLLAIEQPAPTLARATGVPAREVHWVQPLLVAEVAFTEWTDDGRLRHPVFQGLREDKAATDVVREDDRVPTHS